MIFNFPPAKIFMGDCGSNLLGLLLGAVIIEGALKTNALIALVGPLVVLLVPFLDTGFVVAKRLKYKRRPWKGDSNHFHHRLHRKKWKQRQTVLFLYAWTLLMAGIAVALRFIPYSERSGELIPGWAAVMGALLAVAVGASLWAIYVLEILKFLHSAVRDAAGRPRHVRARHRRAGRPRDRDRRVSVDRLVIRGLPVLAGKCEALVPFPST